MVTIERALYKQIKKMDKAELEVYLNSVFIQGYNSGISDFGKELATRVDAGIRKTAGIGEKRYMELVNNINGELNKPMASGN